MAWVHKYESSVNGVSDGTSGVMDKLYDWLTGATPGFPGTLFTGVVKNGRLTYSGGGGSPANITLTNMTRAGATFSQADLAFYALGRGGITYWFMCDLGRTSVVGGSRGFLNTGIFAAIVDDSTGVGTSGTSSQRCDSFKTALSQSTFGESVTGSLNSCLHQIWPTYGAVEADFFSDGDRVHVCIRRSVNSYNSYVHFSLGKIDKASSSWVGGEYISGNSMTDLSSDPIATTSQYWASTARPLLSSIGWPQEYNSSGNAPSPRYGGSILRVVGVKDLSNVTQNYCNISLNLLEQNTKTSSTTPTAFGGVAGGASPKWTTSKSDVNSPPSTSKRNPLKESPNSWNGRAPGFGVDIFYQDLFNTPKTIQLLGSVPGIRFINLTGLSDRQAINNEWMIFPIWSREAARTSWDETIHPDSAHLGIAYKLP